MPATQRFAPDIPSDTPAPPRSAGAPRVPTQLGRYALLFPVGHGGMADVWAACQSNDLGFRKLVAVKIMRAALATDASMRRMFLEEARLAGRIRHANVVEVTDLGEDGEVVYLVMSFVEGAPLSELAKVEAGTTSPRLPLGVALWIIIDALAGLHAAHELRDDDGVSLGLVHRDVSPQNILVGADGVSRLSDFGIAKVDGTARVQTDAGELKGKFAYISPEQLRGAAPTRRSDLFSMGVVLWELLSGRRLFDASGSMDLIKLRMKGEPPGDPREFTPGLPPAVVDVTMRALRDDPSERYESASAMADALERAAAGVTSFGPRHVAKVVTEQTGEALRRVRDEVEAIRTASVVYTPELSAAVRPEKQAPLAAQRISPKHWRAAAGIVFVIVSALLVLRVRARTSSVTETAASAEQLSAVPARPSAGVPSAPATGSAGLAGAPPAPSNSASPISAPLSSSKSRAPTPQAGSEGHARSRAGAAVRRGTASTAPEASAPVFRPTYSSPYER